MSDSASSSAPAAAAAPAPDAPGHGSDRPLFALRQASLGYGRHIVLRDVDLEVHAGEFWCLLGPNGEGKTTLIKTLLGALRPRRGAAYRDPEMFRRGRVSYVPQRLELNPVLPTSVREFVLSGLVGVKADATRRRGRLERVLSLVGLTGSVSRNYWTLSGGQRQRAMVARALIRDPRLLVIDEPTAGLDFAAARAVLDVLEDLHKTYGVTIVFVTHELATAQRYASHVALFRGGVVTAGAKAQVATDQALERTFGVPVSMGQGQGLGQGPGPGLASGTELEAGA